MRILGTTFAPVVCLIIFNLIISDAIGGENYRLVVTKDITYGKERQNIGFLSIKDVPRSGPESFAVDKEGNLYLCDTLNQRIQIFSSGGIYNSTILVNKNILISDVAIGDNKEIYIYDDLHGRLYHYNNEGKMLGSINVDTSRWQSRGPLHVVDDKIYIESIDQEDILVGKVIKKILVAPSNEDLGQPVVKGIHGVSGIRYFVKLMKWKKGEIILLDKGQHAVKKVELPLDGIISIKFLQEDGAGNFYIQTESIKNSAIILNVHKFSYNGDFLTSVFIPENNYSSWAVKLLGVGRNGDIYQFLPAKLKGKINIFRSRDIDYEKK